MSGEPSPADRVQKLHLVGVTTDHEGLILSARRGARSGGYVLTIDEALEEAVDELRLRRADEGVDEEDEPQARPPRVESALPVREIQARLRQGRSIAEVAKAAGVDPEWVDRFAAPILAERAQVIARVRAMPLRRARLGPSAQPIGEAVRQHLADRGVMLTADEFGDAWVARQVAEGRWAVRFSFHHRNRNHVLRFDLDDTTGEVSAADRASGQLGYVAPAAAQLSSKRARRKPKAVPVARSTVKRPVVSTGFRPEPSRGKPVSRSAQERQRAALAMRKAAAQRAAEAERAAARRARERAAEAIRKERERKAAAAKLEREQRERERARAAAERANAAAAKAKRVAAERAKAEKARAAKKAAVKKAAVKKAAVKKAAVKKAAAKKPVARKAPVKKAAVKKMPVKKAAAKKPVVRRAPVKKAAVKKVPVKKVPVKKATVAAAKAPASPVQVPAVSASGGISFDSSSPVAARPSFRRGFVEKAIEDHVHQRPASASPNGQQGEVGRPPQVRPRRRRPLRAT